MTKKEALNLLSYHSRRNSDINNPRWEYGFLGMLRPYKGKLIQNNFIEIMECLKVLESEFNAEVINKEIVANIYGIIYYVNMWNAKGGMLENILTNKEKNILKEWIDIISYSFVSLIENSGEAFIEYENYLEEIR